MPCFCLTIDLDRDVNISVPGRSAAGSLDRGFGTGPRFTSTVRGLENYVELLDDLSVKPTIFAEGRTLEILGDHIGLLDGFDIGVHGYEHEDFFNLSSEEASSVLRKCSETVRDLIGVTPNSFRAPYMNYPDYLDDVLLQTGFAVDSSSPSSDPGVKPIFRSNGLCSVPVSGLRCSDGSLRSGYFWPMHEGKRQWQSYIEMSEKVAEDEIFVMADHTWHIVESRNRGALGSTEIQSNLDNISKIIGNLLDRGFTSATVSQCARAHI